MAGQEGRREQDRGKRGAGKSTLNRLELTPADANEESRYKKIVMDEAAIDKLLVDLHLQSQQRQPEQIVLLDATDDPVQASFTSPQQVREAIDRIVADVSAQT